jgi:trypsin
MLVKAAGARMVLNSMLSIAVCAAIIGGCKSRTYQSTRLKVVSGKPIADDSIPAVIQIEVQVKHNAFYGCTATWVSDSTVLTAAHCVMEAGGNASKISISRGTGKGLKSTRYYVHKSYLSNQAYGRDIAILEFPKKSSSVFIPMALTQAKPGDDLTIIGFGKFDHNIGTSGGQKRIGTNKVRSIDSYGRIEFEGLISPTDKTGTGENVTNSQGDSGGPMIINNRVVGVSSSVDGIPTPQGKLRGFYESVREPSIESWLVQLAKSGVYMIGFTPGTENMDPGKIDSPPPSGGTTTPGGTNTPPIGTDSSQQDSIIPDAPGQTAPPTQSPQPSTPQNPPGSSGNSSSSKLDCNRDFSKIRQGGSGVCLNGSSGYCYRYAGGNVQYDSGRVACSSIAGGGSSGSSIPQTPSPGNGLGSGSVLYECNLDYGKIRSGGSGVCLNGSSGNCYRFSGGDVRYGSGSVSCP